MKRVDLFVIDGQKDFCDPAGSLYVKGAELEALAVAAMISRLKDRKVSTGHKVFKIHASLDSHPKNDCSNHQTWVDRQGNVAPPFTIVTNDDVKNQVWRPRFAYGVWEGQIVSSLDWADNYTAKLAKEGRAPLCLWPPHCEIGRPGSNIYPCLADAYDEWCETTGMWIDFITKGFWAWTEHYSALRADVIDSTVQATQLNTAVINDANEADLILWCGWAGSHCLRWTALDAVNYFGAGNNPFLEKSIFFTDASAPVPNPPGPNAPDFVQWRADFLAEVVSRGAKTMTTAEFLA